MRLLVVRHAIAEDREAFARSHKDDAARPLTPDGRRKMERAALGLKELVPELELLAASPYKRALETAEIIAHAYGDQRVERVPELAPGAGDHRNRRRDEHRRTRGAGPAGATHTSGDRGRRRVWTVPLPAEGQSGRGPPEPVLHPARLYQRDRQVLRGGPDARHSGPPADGHWEPDAPTQVRVR